MPVLSFADWGWRDFNPPPETERIRANEDDDPPSTGATGGAVIGVSGETWSVNDD
jgi:hypothetical protein